MTDTSGSGPFGAGGRPRAPKRVLVLLRHAKAERPTSGPDAERPLTARGHADAAAAGAWLDHGGYLPTVVLCSPAKRTRQTWHDAALGMAAPPTRPVEPAHAAGPTPAGPTPGGPADTPHRSTTMSAGAAPTQRRVPAVRYEPRIYHGYAADLLELVRSTDPHATTLLLIGHNPTISDLSTLLDPVHADPGGLRTSGIVIHGIDDEWADVRENAGPIVKWHTARG
ncbi:histidine phosphatase family protein [Plantactinospora sp. S1510]|uniref:Histidine phosphatase family protein n=1 Tax=Plantactinospora alkalitolerans TaxID=2789879 RepID=A0ABS0GWU4_9ACTN|nr:histidine phosphatase family protein [Plantactinospora alkalitolerans]MBF9130683.1 histidine phosphatase family protein [Plantactinospora alkalitolerans]